MAGLTAGESTLLDRVESAVLARFEGVDRFRQTLIDDDAMLKAIIPYFSPPHPARAKGAISATTKSSFFICRP